MTNASAKLTSCKITPEILPPDPKYPLNRIGVVHVTAAPLGRATNPIPLRNKKQSLIQQELL